MAKQFYTTGEGSQQTLTAADQSKVKVYDSKTDMDSDTSNIAEGEIVATKAGESEGVVEVVDEVTDGVMNPVTSNAVSLALGNSFFEIDSYLRPIGSDGICWTVNRRNEGFALVGWTISDTWTGGQLRTQKVFANASNTVTEGILFTSTGTVPSVVKMICIYMKVE